MDEIIEMLKTFHDDVDYDTHQALMDDGIFDSFDFVNLVAELESELGVDFPFRILSEPKHFNSAEAIYASIQSLDKTR